MSDDVTSVLCVKKEIFVYLLPPVQSTTRGFRAADWGLENPKWTMRGRVVTKEKSKLIIRLEDQTSGTLFAECPVDAYPGVAIEQVNDSSRYFVIRLMSEQGQTKFVGIGFAHREDSFDFLLTIRDHFERLKHEISAEEALRQLREAPKLDMGLKEGQTMRIQLKTKKNPQDDDELLTPSHRPQISLGPSLGSGLLPPPPPGVVSRSRGSTQTAVPAVQQPKLGQQAPGTSLLSFDCDPEPSVPSQRPQTVPTSLVGLDFDPFSSAQTADFASWEKF
ncbi:Adaptin ear-binding coat-associated protein 2 [Cichlidogyrus casuarinus]|uniref:Adaptin ear-binding coat-associated protein 2 n=1 Tax=Cichlidogyrus casuarinus TaxID=1844966 RepID=A0ABD2QAI7_9PLAT